MDVTAGLNVLLWTFHLVFMDITAGVTLLFWTLLLLLLCYEQLQKNYCRCYYIIIDIPAKRTAS
jgi:hypothetical protein